jgi:hypothetical protein
MNHELLRCAEILLSSRADNVLTLEEWVRLARACAALRGNKTADYFSTDDLDSIKRLGIVWDQEKDGSLSRPD